MFHSSKSRLLAVVSLLATCVPLTSAACTNPTVRKEWRQLTTEERTGWLNAVKCLNQLPHNDSFSAAGGGTENGIVAMNTSSSFYDDIVYMHMDLNQLIHQTGRFLPWHRYYTYSFNKALADLCGYNGTTPYWDWSLDSADVKGSSVFDPDSVSGLGGWGSAGDDYHVNDGALGSGSTFRVTYPVPHVIRRNFTLKAWAGDLGVFQPFVTDTTLDGNATFTPEVVSSLISNFTGDFVSFQASFDGFQAMHGAVHLTFSGDLQGTCPADAPEGCFADLSWSPNDPMFFLHHGMIDKIWYDWQHFDAANARAFKGGSVRNLDNTTIVAEYPNGLPPYLDFNSTLFGEGIFPDVTIGDVIDTQDGVLCYVYE